MNRKQLLDNICAISDEICNNAVNSMTKESMDSAVRQGQLTLAQAGKFMSYINGASSMVIRDSYEEYTTLELEKINGWMTDPLYTKMIKGMTSRAPHQIRQYKEYLHMFANSETDRVVKEMLGLAEKGI